MNTILVAVMLQIPAVDTNAPEIVRAGMVAPDVVAVTIQEGSVTLGGLVPYKPNRMMKSR